MLEEAEADYEEHIEPYTILRSKEDCSKFPENPTKEDYIRILKEYPNAVISNMILVKIPFPGYGDLFNWTESDIYINKKDKVEVIKNQTQDFFISVEPVIE